MQDSESFVFKIKPEFNEKIIFLRLLPFHLFISLWIAFFSAIVGHKITEKIPSLYLGIGIGLTIFILFPIVTLSYCKKNYSKAEYFVFKDRIEYKNGMFNFRTKKILFKNIAEVELKINGFQNRMELGNVLLVRKNNNSKKSCKKFNGLCIRDIPNSILIYKKLSELMF
ncbi:hypothetical protein [Fusobacterium sp. MFO224]|uniref:hypothetical protein n=1 Tax=Fusobacterium sp. MFO224 TaxID=3378070 RepID=UPI003854B32D